MRAIHVDPSPATPSQRLTIEVQGFPANQIVSLGLADGASATATTEISTDRTGAGSTDWPVPADWSMLTIEAEGVPQEMVAVM